MNNASQPAFPAPFLSDGVSLRDYFAAAALMGIWSAGDSKAIHALAKSHGITEAQVMSKMAYEAADAMLEERNK